MPVNFSVSVKRKAEGEKPYPQDTVPWPLPPCNVGPKLTIHAKIAVL